MHFDKISFLGKGKSGYSYLFILYDGKLIYIDYEIHTYSDEWNFQNWGLWYWTNSEGIKKFIETGVGNHINEAGTCKPIKTNQETTNKLIELYR